MDDMSGNDTSGNDMRWIPMRWIGTTSRNRTVQGYVVHTLQRCGVIHVNPWVLRVWYYRVWGYHVCYIGMLESDTSPGWMAHRMHVR